MAFPRRSKFYAFSAVTIFVVAASLFYFGNHSFYGNERRDIRVNDAEIAVEIVKSREKLSEGLSGRKSICKNCGMLFEFEQEGNYGFWMKGMRFGLDIIWIDGGEAVHVAKNIPYDFRDTLRPSVRADKVLEINAGMADEYGIKEGDRFRF